MYKTFSQMFAKVMSRMLASPSLPDSEFRTRIERVREKIDEAGVDAGIWFDATSVEYPSHFYHSVTERPVALAITPETTAITVPKLEIVRVKENPFIDEIYHFFDFPGEGPMQTISGMVDDLDIATAAVDMDGPPEAYGYGGPAVGVHLHRITGLGRPDAVGQIRH